MITVKERSREFTPAEEYLMTISPSMVSMKDVPDMKSIPVDGWLIFEDEKEDGKETCTILSIIDPDKNVYSAQSATFRRSLMDIHNVMRGQTYVIKKISGETKVGRPYINCILDLDSLK